MTADLFDAPSDRHDQPTLTGPAAGGRRDEHARAAAIERKTTWLDQTSPAEPGTCPTCREPTLTFRVAQRSVPVVLDGHDVAITRDLAERCPDGHLLIDHCWTWLGERLGWVSTSSRRRTWRRVRAEHTCPAHTKNKTEHK